MSQYSSIKAAVNAYIKQNGRKEITGRILNAVLNATIDSLGKFYQFAGVAVPTTDPEDPDQNVCYLAGEPGTYTHFDNIVLENEEIALLFYNGTWTKQRMLIGIQEVSASVDSQTGTPSVDVSYSEGQLVLTFHNLKGDKGDTGDPAGFGSIGATVDSNIGTPGVTVVSSGPATAKELMFNFTNLKGETGVTSVIATVDNTQGTPSCTVSLVGQQLTLAFSGLKGLKGDTGVSANYPITIYNGLDSDATDQALAAYQGKVLDGKVTQLEAEVTGIHYEITKASASGANTTPVSILSGTKIKLHFDRSGDSYTAYYKFFNAGGTEFVNAGTTADDVELTLSDTAVSFYTYVSGEHTSPLVTTIDSVESIQQDLEKLAEDVQEAVEDVEELGGEVTKIENDINGLSNSRDYSITQGTALNTTNVANHLLIDIPANTPFKAKIDYPGGGTDGVYVIYFYDGSTQKNNLGVANGIEADYILPYKITGIAIYIQNTKALETGTVTVSASFGKVPDELDKKVDKEVLSANLFDPNSPDNILGKSINARGSFIDNPSYFISHPVKVLPGQSVTLNDKPSGTAIAFYFGSTDNSQAATGGGISIISAGSGEVTIKNEKVESVFVRFSGTLAAKDTHYMLNYGETSLPRVEFKRTIVLTTDGVLQTTGTAKDKTMSQDAITKELAIAKEVTDQIVSQKIVDIPVKSSIEYAVTAGTALNTTSANLRFYVDMPSGYIIRVKVNYPQGNKITSVYFYDSDGNHVQKTYNKNDEWMEFSFDVDYASIGFYIAAADALADGTAQVSIQQYGRFTQLEKAVYTELSAKEKLRLADVLYHWMNGEKFPIGFHGDSTTDGVSTTGWTVDNSHPAQDEVAGGRGKADYVCELTYPKQLQNLLRAELGGNTLRIYNIGYYGASLYNNWNQLDAIYSDVYSDVKMVGIVLGINDRGSYNTPADFYAGVKDWLVKYVEYFFAKGIVPFMITNQVVTQCGFRPLDGGGGEYSQMNEDYVQTLCNKAKEEVARYYGLEVIDMNNFDRLVLESSSYAYANITEGLHFKDLGHKLEAGFLFSQLVPWVNRTDDAKEIYFGFNCAKSRTNFQVSRYKTDVNDKFKFQLNTTQASATDTLLFDAYMFNNSKNGAYTVKYLTPVASGYIVVDGDTANPIQITATEMNLGPWDIGLHHIQVYTGASTTVAFKGFLLESVN